MPLDLPTELLRALAAFADGGSLERAGATLGRTASAVSLQLSRLNTLTPAVLLERRGRRLALTPAGELLLRHAREILARHDAALAALSGAAAAGRVRLGLVQDLVEGLGRAVLAELRAEHPLAQIDIAVDGSAALQEHWAAGALDVIAAAAPPGAQVLREEPMLWIGAPRLVQLAELPLVLVAPPCPFATAATAALAAAQRPYRVAMRTPSLSGALAAVRAEWGIGCRSGLAGVAGLAIGPEAGLPALPKIGYAVAAGPDLSPAGRLAVAAATRWLRAQP